MGKNISIIALQLILLTIVSFGLHYVALEVFQMQAHWDVAHYNLLQLYFFAFLTTLIMSGLMIVVEKFLPQNLGFAFLIVLTIKVIGSYLFMQPVLDLGEAQDFVKHNFLAIFLMYLCFDVYVSYRLLNIKNEV